MGISSPEHIDFIAQESLISHLQFQILNQSWQPTLARYEELQKSLTKITCCGNRKDFQVDMNGQIVRQ